MTSPKKPSEVYDWCVANLDKSEYDTYKSDLYIKAVPKAQKMLDGFVCKSLLSTFRADDGTLWYELPFGALGVYIHEKGKERVENSLVVLEMRFQELGADLVRSLDCGFDPDAYYTPTEIAFGALCETLGYDYHDIVRKAHESLKRMRAEKTSARSDTRGRGQ